jgi:hypothetical protein
VYELRVYHANAGKLDDLLKGFPEHTTRLFEKRGMRSVAYWTPLDDPLKGKTLSVRGNGKLADKVDSAFTVLTDFSTAL